MASSGRPNILRAFARRYNPLLLRCCSRAFEQALSASIQLRGGWQLYIDISAADVLIQLEMGGREVQLIVRQFRLDVVCSLVAVYGRLVIPSTEGSVSLERIEVSGQSKH